MKIIFLFFTLSFSPIVLANLYLTTEYQEANKAQVITKHHIFLNKKYMVNYTKMAYAVTLTKIENDSGTIETETYEINEKGQKTLTSGGIGNFKLGAPIVRELFSRTGKREFMFKIIPEKIVP